VAVAAQALLVAERLGEGLAQGDADVLDGVVVVDVRVALAVNVEVDQAVADDLVEHVIEEGHAGIELALPAAIEIDAHGDLGFEGVACDFCLPHGGYRPKWDDCRS
jgi:hypothetical protein